MTITGFLLAAAPEASRIERQADWWAAFRTDAADWNTTLEKAVAGGFRADRLAWAFCAGYQSALRRLFPRLAADRMASFCATEAGGNAPKAIHARLERTGTGWRLDGEKSWASVADPESILYVVARSGDPAAARPELRVVAVEAGTGGISIHPMPPPGFVPEVFHARIVLEDVRVAEENVLPGDGYDAYLKPFRAIEDIHVTAAVLAYLVREGRARQWPRPWAQQVLAVLLSLAEVDAHDFTSPPGHIALAGALGLAGDLIAQAEDFWSAVSLEDPARRRWARDRRLLEVASTARKARIESAWRKLSGDR
ncbi:MAG TPA: acyl-CoA dehydrogenase family protein [Rhodocyclaceae bacterium]|nr:acyl-CoA dehydrogenase family protein [Rhodocyclaceae bacterium]